MTASRPKRCTAASGTLAAVPLLALVSVAVLVFAAAAAAEPPRAGDDGRALAFALTGAEIARPAPQGAALALVPVPTATVGLLPPGIRPNSERIALTKGSDGVGAATGLRIHERVEDQEESDWLDVEYTIDRELDAWIRAEFAERDLPMGQVVLLDPHTGRVLAYVSTDPESFPPTRAYPTASLMKVVTTAAALRHAPEALQRDCRYVGNPYRLPPRTVGTEAEGTTASPFERAIAISNNQCFARLTVDELGEDALLEELARIGLTEPPAPKHAPGRIDEIHDRADLAKLGSGLAGSFITPLGAARLAALLVHGELVQPYWIARVRDERGRIVSATDRRNSRRVWSPEQAERMRDLLVGVTTSGTARRAFRDGNGVPRLGPLEVAGKTGSLSGTDPHGWYSWFIGVAPADEPRVAIASVVLNGPFRRNAAAEVAASTLAEVFCREGVCDAANADRLVADVSEPVPAPPDYRATSDLDAVPRPLAFEAFDFPRRLRRHPVDGEIVLSLTLDASGEVLDAEVAASDLPEFEAFVIEEVRGWRFTPPTRQGRPVVATARLPIPIQIR